MVGDIKHKPLEIEIALGILPSDLEFALLARCVHPSHFRPMGQVIAQAIPIPNLPPLLPIPHDDSQLAVYWEEVVGEDKPLVWCALRKGGDSIQLWGMMDTGEEVTLLPPCK